MEFIFELPGNLSSEVCKDIIKRFEEDPKKYPGLVASGEARPSVKRSVDLRLTSNKNFDDLDKVLYEQLKIGIKKYKEYLKEKLSHIDVIDKVIHSTLDRINDTGYQVQRIKKGDFYIWHSDFSPDDQRMIAFIWYLNTIDEGIGGTTDFYCNKSVRPEEGKLLMFPATWTYLHTGVKLEADVSKYIVTGFIRFEKN